MNGNSSKTAEKKNGVKTEKKVNSVDKSKPQTKNASCEFDEAAESKINQLAFYEEIYKQVESGNDGIVAAMPYVETKALKNLFVGQQKSYETLAVDLKTKICQMGGKAEKPNLMTKMMMKGGMLMETLTDQSESKLAELVMKGVNMGIISLTRLLNNSQGNEVDIQYGNKLMSLYEKQIEVLKTYL